MSEPIQCFKIHGRADLQKKFDDTLKEGMSAKQVAREIILQEHESLHKEMETLKKQVVKNYKPAPYQRSDNSEKIKAINEKYAAKEPAQPTEPIASKEEVKPVEPANQDQQPAGEGTPPPSEGAKVTTGQPEGSKVGVSHAALTDLSKRLGIDFPERGEYHPPEWYAERGRKLLAEGAKPEDVSNPNNELHDRISVARAHLENIVKQADDIAKTNPEGTDSKEYKAAHEKVNEYSNDVVKKLGTKAHQAMVSLQGDRDVDTDSFTAVKKSLEEDSGKPATKEQDKKIQELTTQNESLKKQTADLEQKLIIATEENVGGKKPKSTTDKPKKTHEEYVKERKDSFQAAREALKKLRTGESGLGVGVPLVRELSAVAPHMAKIVKSLIEEGVDRLGDIVDVIHEELSKDMAGLRRRDVLDLVAGDYVKEKDEPTPFNKYADIKKQSKLVKQLEDLQNGLPENFDASKPEQSPEVKDLLEKIKKVKKDLADMGYMKKGSDVHKTPLTAEEKSINRLQKELDDLSAGIAKQKNPSRESTEREKRLKEQIKDAREKLGLVPSKEEKPLTPEEKIEEDKKELEAVQEQFIDKEGNSFSPEESKVVWDYAKKTYLDNGVSYRDMIGNVSNDLGLSWRQVSSAITTPKVKRISDEMWKKQADYRKNQTATKNWVEAQNKSVPFKAVRKISQAFRGVAVFGHGGIFIGTHAGMTLFNPSQWHAVIPAFIRGWKFAYGNRGNYERRIEQLKNSPNYVLAQRSGLKNNPDVVNTEEFQKSQEIFKKIGGEAGIKGFNAIKVLRQDLFDYHYNRLSETEKNDVGSAQQIARLVNNATGASNLKIPEVVNEITFAGGMEAARWGKLTRNPLRATAIAVKALVTPDKATTAERIFAKVWARRVGEQIGTYAGLLVTNAAIQNTLNPNNPVNLFNPNKPDWLKFKFGNVTIDPTSGMRGAALFIYGIGKIPFESKKELRGDTRVQSAGKQAFSYGRGKLAPLYSTIADFFAQSDFNKNPLPFSNDKPGAGHHKLTWGEYLWEKAPLPVAHAAQEMYHSALDNGTDKITLNHVLNGIMSGALSGGTGFRVGEYNAEESDHSPFTAEDKKDPTFKYFLDKGMELPNTALTSEKVKDQATHTEKALSEYPKEVRDSYTEKHKQHLKTELQSIRKQGFVFVDAYGDVSKLPTAPSTIQAAQDFALLKRKKIDELNDKELAQVLKIAQSEATEKTKKELFYNKRK